MKDDNVLQMLNLYQLFLQKFAGPRVIISLEDRQKAENFISNNVSIDMVCIYCYLLPDTLFSLHTKILGKGYDLFLQNSLNFSMELNIMRK